jgi:hypothetical protein
VQPGVVPQPREELDPGLALLGGDQRPDRALEGIAAVEDGEVPSKTARCRPPLIVACSRIRPTANSHSVRNTSLGPAVPDRAGNCDLRKYSLPESGKNQAGPPGFSSSAPQATQLCARTVAARLGQRAVYSWNVQVPQACSPERWTFVSSTAETR